MTDDELNLAITGTQLALAYLEGKGRDWDLATSPLRIEIMQLESYKRNRERK